VGERYNLFLSPGTVRVVFAENHEAWRRLYARMLPRGARMRTLMSGRGSCACLDPERVPRPGGTSTCSRPLTGLRAKAVQRLIRSFCFFDCCASRIPYHDTRSDAGRAGTNLPEPDFSTDVAGHVPMHTARHFAETRCGLANAPTRRPTEIVSGIRAEEARVHHANPDHHGHGPLFWSPSSRLMRSPGGLRVMAEGCPKARSGRSNIDWFSRRCGGAR